MSTRVERSLDVGGSGGGGYFSGDPKRVARELAASQKGSDDQEFQAKVNAALQGLLTIFNNRDREAIDRRLKQILAALSTDLDEAVDLRFGGSVAKHTFVDGLSDVDALVLLNNSDLASLNPREARAYFLRQLQDHFGGEAKVTEGTLAVTVAFADIEIQLLPAFKTEAGYRIPSEDTAGWAHVSPLAFAKRLSSVNASNESKVVPVIKLAKAINDNLPEPQRLSSHHIEAMAVEVFSSYKGTPTLKEMLQHFFAQGSARVRTPIRDVTGQSGYVDEYLGAAGSLKRRLASDGMELIAKRIRNADAGQSVKQIEALFDS